MQKMINNLIKKLNKLNKIYKLGVKKRTNKLIINQKMINSKI